MVIIVFMPRSLKVQKRRPVLGMAIPPIALARRLNHSITLNLGLPSSSASIIFFASHLEFRDAPARTFLIRWPAAAYMSALESWHELPGGQIEFTMKRLRSAD
jgi:hypothetical protein